MNLAKYNETKKGCQASNWCLYTDGKTLAQACKEVVITTIVDLYIEPEMARTAFGK